MKGLLLAAALLASTPGVAEIPSMKVSTWLTLSPDMRATYIAGLWVGFKNQMPVHDAAHYAACIDKRGLTASQLATELAVDALAKRYSPDSVSSLLLRHMIEVCGPPAGR